MQIFENEVKIKLPVKMNETFLLTLRKNYVVRFSVHVNKSIRTCEQNHS